MTPSNKSIDETDLEILRLLQNDARISYKELASKLGVAIGTVHNRVKKLWQEKIIKRVMVVIDPLKVGYDFTALILLKLKGGHLKQVEEEIAESAEEVVYVLDITGEWDCAIVARFRDRIHLDRFIKNLQSNDNIERTYTSMVLNTVKEDFSVHI